MEECRLVAEEEGTVIAWAALSPYSSRSVYAGVASVSIYVKGDCKGRKVGEHLLTAVIMESERIGLWMLQSSIIEINSRSLALHKKCGFRVVGFREKIAQDYYGNWQNVVLTERRSMIVGV
jgi:phosphinothricin acetyltransferase